MIFICKVETRQKSDDQLLFTSLVEVGGADSFSAFKAWTNEEVRPRDQYFVPLQFWYPNPRTELLPSPRISGFGVDISPKI